MRAQRNFGAIRQEWTSTVDVWCIVEIPVQNGAVVPSKTTSCSGHHFQAGVGISWEGILSAKSEIRSCTWCRMVLCSALLRTLQMAE